jgi:pyridoxal/pyridoxine/pyridoxamine kinase
LDPRVEVLDDGELGELVAGLEANQINRYTHILTGYIGSRSFLLKLAEVVKQLKAVNPGAGLLLCFRGHLQVLQIGKFRC